VKSLERAPDLYQVIRPAGLALLDILIPFEMWRTLAIVSAAVSLALLLIFWNTYVIVGVAIDLAILAIVIFTNWTPD